MLKFIWGCFGQDIHHFLVSADFLFILLDFVVHFGHPFLRVLYLLPHAFVSLSLWYHIFLDRLLDLLSLFACFLKLSFFHRHFHENIGVGRLLVGYLIKVDSLTLLFQVVELIIQLLHFFNVLVLFGQLYFEIFLYLFEFLLDMRAVLDETATCHVVIIF